MSISRYRKSRQILAIFFIILLGCYVFLCFNKKASNPKVMRESGVVREIFFGLLMSFSETDVRTDYQSSKNASYSWKVYFSPQNERKFCLPSETLYIQEESSDDLSLFYLSKNTSYYRRYVIAASKHNGDFIVIAYYPDWPELYLVSSKNRDLIALFYDQNNYYRRIFEKKEAVENFDLFQELYLRSYGFAFLTHEGKISYNKKPFSTVDK